MATAAYDRENTTRINLKLNNFTDADIIQKLEGVDNMQGYIKDLIRANTHYRIRPEFADNWGPDYTEDVVISGSDLEMIARGWETPISEILDQLEPID